MEDELSKLMEKWVKEFDSLSNFFGDDIRMWIVDYINLNHNFYISLSKAHDDAIEIEKKYFKLKSKKK